MLRHRRKSFIELDLGEGVWPVPAFTTDKDTAALHKLLMQVSCIIGITHLETWVVSVSMDGSIPGCSYTVLISGALIHESTHFHRPCRPHGVQMVPIANKESSSFSFVVSVICVCCGSLIHISNL